MGVRGLEHCCENGAWRGGWCRTSVIFFRRSAISMQRATISAEHKVCCLRGGHTAFL